METIESNRHFIQQNKILLRESNVMCSTRCEKKKKKKRRIILLDVVSFLDNTNDDDKKKNFENKINFKIKQFQKKWNRNILKENNERH